MSTINIAVPWRYDRRGRTALATDQDHLRDMIEQLLFTSPGERVNLPDFGCGLRQLVFAPNSPEMAAALQFTLQAALQRWLGDLILVQTLQVSSVEATLNINIQYSLRNSKQTVPPLLITGSV
jgi:uncharacterized protein